jgi:hypothetical protein
VSRYTYQNSFPALSYECYKTPPPLPIRRIQIQPTYFLSFLNIRKTSLDITLPSSLPNLPFLEGRAGTFLEPTYLLNFLSHLTNVLPVSRGYTVAHCATSRKVAGSIPDVVIGIFLWHNPSGRSMSLRSTQPLKERSTRNIFWVVKAAGA